MENESIAAQLYRAAEQLQATARDLQNRATVIYNDAAKLKALVVSAAESLTPTEEVKG